MLPNIRLLVEEERGLRTKRVQIRRLKKVMIVYQKSLLVLQNFSTARKSGNISYILKAFFVRHSSEYETSDSDRKFIESLFKIYIARCGYTWLDESNWPMSGQFAQLPLLT